MFLNHASYGNVQLRDALYVDSLMCPFEDWAMGLAGEFIADEFDVTHEEMGRFALSSHRKALLLSTMVNSRTKLFQLE